MTKAFGLSSIRYDPKTSSTIFIGAPISKTSNRPTYRSAPSKTNPDPAPQPQPAEKTPPKAEEPPKQAPPTIEQLLQRIEELERRVKDLEKALAEKP